MCGRSVHNGLLHVSTHLQEASCSAQLTRSRFSRDILMRNVSPLVCCWIYIFLRDEGKKTSLNAWKRHMIKNASWKRKLIKRVLSLLCLRWVESSAWCLILSCSMMHRPAPGSRRPRRRGWRISWAEPPLQWYNTALTWFSYRSFFDLGLLLSLVGYADPFCPCV